MEKYVQLPSTMTTKAHIGNDKLSCAEKNTITLLQTIGLMQLMQLEHLQAGALLANIKVALSWADVDTVFPHPFVNSFFFRLADAAFSCQRFPHFILVFFDLFLDLRCLVFFIFLLPLIRLHTLQCKGFFFGFILHGWRTRVRVPG